MSEQTPSSPAPGWYPNPDGEGLRWWDGSTWTEHLHGETPPTPEPEPAPESSAGPPGSAPPGSAATVSATPTPAGTSTGAAASGLPAASDGDGPRRIFGVRIWVLLALAVLVAVALLLPMVIFDDDEEPEAAPARQDGSGKNSGDAEPKSGISLLAVSDPSGAYTITVA